MTNFSASALLLVLLSSSQGSAFVPAAISSSTSSSLFPTTTTTSSSSFSCRRTTQCSLSTRVAETETTATSSSSSSSSSSSQALASSTATAASPSTASATKSGSSGKNSKSTTSNSSSSGGEPRKRILNEPALWEYNFGLQDPQLTLPHGITPRVTPPETFAISQEQIRTLEEDGVVLIRSVFDDDWVNYLRSATGHQVSNPHFWAFAGTASKLYDYIQRNIWQTNKAFADFYYHSAMGHVLAQCGRTEEIRISTDLLMVNPNKGFKWHQDNQNGPITWEEGIRFWITMDETPADYGAPVYLKGSHRNSVVEEQAVFVDIEMQGLEEYKDQWLSFRTMPGDMLIWHPRTIHKVDGPSDGIWTSYRRVLGGTAAKAGSLYHDKRGTGGVLSDLGRHGLEDGVNLSSPFFPLVYPQFDRMEAAARDDGSVGRDPRDIVAKIGGLAGKASGEKFASFFKVLGSQAKE